MKRLVILALAVALAPPAVAQLYKYVDKNGKTVYSDTPPPDADGKTIRVPTGGVSNVPAPAKSAVEQNKENEKARKADAEKGKKASEEAARSASGGRQGPCACDPACPQGQRARAPRARAARVSGSPMTIFLGGVLQ